MEMEKFEKNSTLKDHFEVVSETVRSTVFSFIPLGPVFDSLWNYRANVKQKRIIDFSESVKKTLDEISGEELHASNFETEDFVDIMEAVYMRVMNTRSVYKLERFRNILVNQIIDPDLETPMFMKYIQLLDQLDDAQIVILSDFRYWENEKIIGISVAYMGDVGAKFDDNHVVKELSGRLKKDVTKAEIEYFTNELVSLGLVRNNATVITAMGSSSPQNDFKISPIGKSFLKFIELNGETSS